MTPKTQTAAAPAAAAAPARGAYFGLPGVTQRFEQWDTILNSVTTLQQASPVAFAPSSDLQKTDVILWWEMVFTVTSTITPGSSTVTQSVYSPYNLLQGFNLQLQGQYKPVDVQSGFDAAIFQLYRPMRKPGYGTNLGANPETIAAQSAIFDSNRVANVAMTSATTPITFILDIPVSLFIDEYWDLALDGTILPNPAGVVAPIAAHISPQYMGGSERVVRPRFNYAAGFASSQDQGPFQATSGSGTAVQSSSASVRRIGIYGSNNQAEMPPVFNWQYQRISRQVGWGAQNVLNIPLTDYGQLLSVFVRLFDPGSGTFGSPVSLSTVSKCQILYGSSIPRFDDTPTTMQERFVQQHGVLNPVGTLIWDMAITARNTISNAGALNTLTNSNVTVHLEFSSVPSAQAYAVVGYEALVYVSPN